VHKHVVKMRGEATEVFIQAQRRCGFHCSKTIFTNIGKSPLSRNTLRSRKLSRCSCWQTFMRNNRSSLHPP